MSILPPGRSLSRERLAGAMLVYLLDELPVIAMTRYGELESERPMLLGVVALLVFLLSTAGRSR